MTTTVPNDIREKVNERIAELDELTLKNWGFSLEPSLDYSLKGKVAGQAWIYENRIRLNAYALVNNLDDYLLQTIGHEYAHLTAHNHFGQAIRPHGKEWASVMRSYGLPAKRCHSYNVKPARKTTRYEYFCDKCGVSMKVGKIRHNKMAKGSIYIHSDCGGRIAFSGIIER